MSLWLPLLPPLLPPLLTGNRPKSVSQPRKPPILTRNRPKSVSRSPKPPLLTRNRPKSVSRSPKLPFLTENRPKLVSQPLRSLPPPRKRPPQPPPLRKPPRPLPPSPRQSPGGRFRRLRAGRLASRPRWHSCSGLSCSCRVWRRISRTSFSTRKKNSQS